MKIPDVTIPVTVVRLPMELLMKHERAVEQVHDRMLRTTRALDKVGVPHAVLILKLIPFRLIDQVHIADMCRVGLIDDALAEQIPPELRPRLEEIRASPDG